MNIQYGKKISTTNIYDGQETTPTQELEVSVISSRENILKDVIDSMLVISRGESNRLIMEIEINTKGRYRLIKRWSVK